MKANTHPPQEILIKVPCSERLPSELGAYVTDLHLLPYDPDEGRWMFDLKPSYWYEPATRVVLTVEEWETLQNKINLLAADNRRLMAKHTNPYKY